MLTFLVFALCLMRICTCEEITMLRVVQVPNLACLLVMIVTLMAIVFLVLHLSHSGKARPRPARPPPMVIEWHKIRHLWM